MTNQGTCAWCARKLDNKTAASRPVTIHPGAFVVCAKCWYFDDGDRS